MDRSKLKEKAYKVLFAATAILCIIAVIAIFAFLIAESVPAFRKIGFFEFVLGSDWKPASSDTYAAPLSGRYGCSAGYSDSSLRYSFRNSARSA